MAERHYHGFGVLTKVVLIILRKVLQGLPETCRTALKELNMNNPRCEPLMMPALKGRKKNVSCFTELWKSMFLFNPCKSKRSS